MAVFQCNDSICADAEIITDAKPDETDVQDDEFDGLTFTVEGAKFKMVRVEGGTFTMGATPKQAAQAGLDERPAHQVMLRSYYIGQAPVTQKLWQAVMGGNPCYHSRRNDYRDCGRRPVESVSWYDCKRFIDRLNELLKDQLKGKRFRLPTEAEWEFAARGGNKGKNNDHLYAGSDDIDQVAWYEGNSGSQTHPVMQKQPNELGLYDMSGNVFEWCEDYWAGYSSEPQDNPTGLASGSCRVNRGGCWNGNAGACRVSYRGFGAPSGAGRSLGLRLAL